MVFDPKLFEKRHWNLNDRPSLQHFRMFCESYVTQMRFHHKLIMQLELDGFIAMLHDQRFFHKVYNLIDFLRREQYSV